MSRSIPRPLRCRADRPRRHQSLPAFAAIALAALACTTTTEAADEAADETAQIVVEAFIVEAQRPVFDTRYDAVAAAARGQAADLLPAGSGTTLAERLATAEESGALTLLAAPTFVVRSGERAYVQSGLQIPVQTVTGEAVTVQFVNATLRLEVSPQVTEGSKIALELSAQKRFPDPAALGEGSPGSPIQTTEAFTSLIVDDGGTAVVGGVFETRAEAQSGSSQERGNELVVLVTPRILDL